MTAATAYAMANETPLTHWLRLLWNIAPPLRLSSEAPFIAAGAIHLPARAHWREHRAAAAHAAAHLVYSPPLFDGAGVVPIARALTGLLEDARVEALAIEQLPGLARLWRPLHEATPALGGGFEALMQRLARALADPAYEDAEPWVRKGVALFYGDGRRGPPLLRTAAEVRAAAMRLGHDIGQRRLQFNVKTYRPWPAYRDDHRWMWPADLQSATPPPAVVAAATARDDEVVREPQAVTACYPEWDRLISRLRADWCSVIESAPDRNAPPVIDAAGAAAIQQTAGRLRRSLHALSHGLAAPQLQHEGELFDPAALVDWRVARRLRQSSMPPVYRGLAPRAAPAAVWLLVDQSASAAEAQQADGPSALRNAVTAAAAAATALQSAGVSCAIAGFSSNGRQAVRLVTVKTFAQAADADMVARLQALRAGGSTRLGAALRHAASAVAAHAAGRRWVIVLSDGEPHDIDVFDPRYLIADARHAVQAAARRGVRMVCLGLAPDRCSDARRIFGRAGVQPVRGLGDVPRALTRLLA
jgi:uncharacterized protein YegL